MGGVPTSTPDGHRALPIVRSPPRGAARSRTAALSYWPASLQTCGRSERTLRVTARSSRTASRHDSDDEPANLAVRVPKTLHRALKLHCTLREVMIADFVEQAIREKLRRKVH